MEKIDILLIAVFIFGAATFFAISYCIRLHRCLNDVYDILNSHKIIFEHQNGINLHFVNTFEGIDKQIKTQIKFNTCVIDNIDKLERKVNNVAKAECDTSSTGGRRSEAEA